MLGTTRLGGAGVLARVAAGDAPFGTRALRLGFRARGFAAREAAAVIARDPFDRREKLERRRHDLLGHAVRVLQLDELFAREVSPRPRTQALGVDAGEREPGETHDREPRRVAHAADLLVSPLVDRHLEPRLARFVTNHPHLRGGSLAIVELDAVHPALDVLLLHLAGDLDDVRLRNLAARVQEPLREVAVVGHQQDAAGVEVEASDGVHARGNAADQVLDRGPPFRVVQRRHHQARLVDDEVHQVFSDEPPSVDLDLVDAGVGTGPELGHHVPVHSHASAGDQRLGVPSRRDACAREYLLQSLNGHLCLRHEARV